MLKGIPASPGIAVGKVFVFNQEEPFIRPRKLRSTEVKGEVDRFLEAVEKTKKDVLRIKNEIKSQLSQDEANIFDAHLMLLEDPMLINKTVEFIDSNGFCAEYSFFINIERVSKIFKKMEDHYLKERSLDLKDIAHRILDNLIGTDGNPLSHLQGKVIIVAPHMTPSDIAVVDRKNVQGIVTEMGGQTSHTAILAKSLEIPAVVGIRNLSVSLKNDETILVDGFQGQVIVNPDRRTISRYFSRREKHSRLEKELAGLRDYPAMTTDGKVITLSANIELPHEVDAVLAHGADGIGLFRTEFLFMTSNRVPTETEQYKIYKSIAEKMGKKRVIIRTFDLGGDKLSLEQSGRKENNPFLGWRAIRICLENTVFFRDQLRAILKASVHGNIAVMFPMISSVEEFREAKSHLTEVMDELERQEISFNRNLPVGITIEVPAAVVLADQLSQEADFLSIGTNDLIQFVLAIDRSNQKTSKLYEPHHPAVLRVIKTVIDRGHQAGIEVGLCGEMAAQLRSAVLLVGLGLDALSMTPMFLPEIKKVIRSISFEEARGMTDKVLEMSTTAEVNKYLNSQFRVRIRGFDKLARIQEY